MTDPRPRMTSAAGIPVPDNQNSLTAGPRGPVLMQDFFLIEKMAHFNRERIPERVVHAKGAGAYGTFTVTGDITRYTSAKFLGAVGKQTPVVVRFSTVAGEKGSADTARDPRGFAVKFYTEDGNWDMVGNNTPVFFIRDPLKFSDFIHSQKRDPQTNLRSNTMQWDFWSQSPESLHQIVWLFGDRGIPDGFRFMNGYSSHALSLYTHDGNRVWCKWHFKTAQGIRNLRPEAAAKLAGEDPDYATRDLFDAIKRGEFPKWNVFVQVMTDVQAKDAPFNPFDLTKVWPHGDYPLIPVGVMELNRNPENYFAEIEQGAWAPANVVPGIGHSPDKMLQARILSYPDAHRYRLGVNYEALPVNRPQCPYAHYHRDGSMRFDGNGGGTPNYQPNSFGGPVEKPPFVEPPFPIDGPGSRYDHRDGNDDYSQAGALFRLMAADEQQRLIANFAGAMSDVPVEIQRRQIDHFMRVDEALGNGVASKLGLTG